MESILKRLQNLGEGRQKHFLDTSSIEYLRVSFLKGMEFIIFPFLDTSNTLPMHLHHAPLYSALWVMTTDSLTCIVIFILTLSCII